MTSEQLKEIGCSTVDLAVRKGATEADVIVRESDDFSTTVRLGKIDKLTEAASTSLTLQVFLGHRSATVFTSEFSSASLDRLVGRAVAMAGAISEDPSSGLAAPEQVGSYEGDLALYSEDVTRMTTGEKVDSARRAETAAFNADPRIKNSEGSTFKSKVVTKVYASSHGFAGSYRSSYCVLSVIPVARPTGQAKGGMQRDYWYSVARSAASLDSPEAVGRKAAERTVRRLGARKIRTCNVPVIFDPETASSLLGHIFEAVRGDAIYRNASFLAGKLQSRVAAENVTVVDDGLRAGGFGTRPFDDEGIPASSTCVIEKGILRSYLLNCYAARKLGLPTTGNAARGRAGPPSISAKNFFLAPGSSRPEEIVGSVSEGFYVTELFGFGFNVVTGEYSRGAAGLWIEKGELGQPVEEVTIGGNFGEMLSQIKMIGSDLEFRGPVSSPTLWVDGLTVAGT